MAEQFSAVQRTLLERLRDTAAFLHGKASGRINYNASTEKRNTYGEGSYQLPRTEGNSRLRHTGVEMAAGD
jgi:hypothetical protein